MRSLEKLTFAGHKVIDTVSLRYLSAIITFSDFGFKYLERSYLILRFSRN